MEFLKVDSRKKSILHLTVEDYIDTAEPIASAVLQKKHFSDYSPATIRHELNELEKEGYLSQPHVSSGRIPTDKGYRFYVDHIIPTASSLDSELHHIQAELGRHTGHNFYFNLLESILPFVSGVTFLLQPSSFEAYIKGFHLLRLDRCQLLLISWDSKNNKKESIVMFNQDYTQDQLNYFSSRISYFLSGKDLEKLDLKKLLLEFSEFPKEIVYALDQEIHSLKNQNKSNTLFILGLSNLLKHPEFKSAQQANPVVEILDQRQTLATLLETQLDTPQEVWIGEENKHQNLKSCSIIVKRFFNSNQELGLVGMIGPKRMHYGFILPFMSSISSIIESCLKIANKGEANGRQ